MEMDADTFLVAVYTVVDDLYRTHYAPHKPIRRGRPPQLADSEVLTLMLLCQWRQDRSQAAFVRWVHAHRLADFPAMLTPTAFGRRVRDLTGVLCQLGPLISQQLGVLVGTPQYEIIDAVPVPLMRRCRGERHRLFGAEAAVGRGGSDAHWYYGCSLCDVVLADGVISGFVVGPASTNERWLAECLYRWRLDPWAPQPESEELAAVLGRRHRHDRIGPTGPIRGRQAVGMPTTPYVLADAGFVGQLWQTHWQQCYGMRLVTHADADLTPAARAVLRPRYAAARQLIETVHSILLGVFGLAYPRARSGWGLLVRLAAKVAAFNLAVYLNYLFGRPTLSIFNPLD